MLSIRTTTFIFCKLFHELVVFSQVTNAMRRHQVPLGMSATTRKRNNVIHVEIIMVNSPVAYMADISKLLDDKAVIYFSICRKLLSGFISSGEFTRPQWIFCNIGALVLPSLFWMFGYISSCMLKLVLTVTQILLASYNLPLFFRQSYICITTKLISALLTTKSQTIFRACFFMKFAQWFFHVTLKASFRVHGVSKRKRGLNNDYRFISDALFALRFITRFFCFVWVKFAKVLFYTTQFALLRDRIKRIMVHCKHSYHPSNQGGYLAVDRATNTLYGVFLSLPLYLISAILYI